MGNKKAAGTVSDASQADRNGSVYYIEANLEIQNIEDARRDLIESLGRALPLTVDVSRITSIDTAGVQLLLGLRNAAPKHGVSLEIRGESAALTNALAMLGLQGALTLAPRHGEQ